MRRAIQTLIAVVLTLISDYARSGESPKYFTNSIGMRFRLIPAGEFMMGARESESDLLGDEGPQHRVRITKPFYLGVTEVTQEQYRKVVDNNPSRFEGETRPVERVNWNDAATFCKRLSAKEGQVYRLPTEAEWEYACRAGSKASYCFGDEETLLVEFAWFGETSKNTTHPVGEQAERMGPIRHAR